MTQEQPEEGRRGGPTARLLAANNPNQPAKENFKLQFTQIVKSWTAGITKDSNLIMLDVSFECLGKITKIQK